MALNWSWNEKVGYLEFKDDVAYKVNLYRSNALMCAISEWEHEGKELYNLHLFFSNKDHAKRCLGLVKNTSCLLDDNLKEIHLDMKDEDCQQFGPLLMKAINKYDLGIKVSYENILQG